MNFDVVKICVLNVFCGVIKFFYCMIYFFMGYWMWNIIVFF